MMELSAANSSRTKGEVWARISVILDELRALGWPIVEHIESPGTVFLVVHGYQVPTLEASAGKSMDVPPALHAARMLLEAAHKYRQDHPALAAGQEPPRQATQPELEPLLVVDQEEDDASAAAYTPEEATPAKTLNSQEEGGPSTPAASPGLPPVEDHQEKPDPAWEEVLRHSMKVDPIPDTRSTPAPPKDNDLYKTLPF